MWHALSLGMALCVVTPARHVSLATWNLLAPVFAPPEKYPWARQDLRWPLRQDRIVARLASIDADVLCLQEVEVGMWDGLLERLHALGYDGVLQEMSRGHPIANAVLVRRGMLEIVRTESRSRALIAVVRACDSSGSARPSPPLYVTSVHLEAGNEKHGQRLFQLRSLLRRIELQHAIDVASAQGRQKTLSPGVGLDSAAVVLAGDFNFDRASDLHCMLAKATMPQDVKAKGKVSTQLLPLRDAYLESPTPWGPPLRSSYRNGRLLDFVWTSSAVHLLRTMPVDDLAGSMQPRNVPSSAHPSDHLPIGALLTWAGAPGATDCRPSWQHLCVQNVQQQQQPEQQEPTRR